MTKKTTYTVVTGGDRHGSSFRYDDKAEAVSHFDRLTQERPAGIETVAVYQDLLTISDDDGMIEDGQIVATVAEWERDATR